MAGDGGRGGAEWLRQMALKDRKVFHVRNGVDAREETTRLGELCSVQDCYTYTILVMRPELCEECIWWRLDDPGSISAKVQLLVSAGVLSHKSYPNASEVTVLGDRPLS